MAVSSEAERVFKKISKLNKRFDSMRGRSEEGYLFEQLVSDEELVELMNEIVSLRNETFDFFSSRMDEYKEMEKKLSLLEEKVNLAYKAKRFISSK